MGEDMKMTSSKMDMAPSMMDMKMGMMDMAREKDLAGSFFPFDQGKPPMLPPHGIAGRVLSTSGLPIANATVEVFGRDGQALAGAVMTNAQGEYTLELDPTGLVTVRIAADGYARGHERLKIREGTTSALVTRMSPLAPAIAIDVATGGEVVSLNGFALDVPAGAFVKENGAAVSGSVDVHVTPLDRRTLSEVLAHPSDFIGRTADNVSVSLRAASSVDITVLQGDERLKLADGKVIEATLPFLDESAPEDGILAYAYDEVSGIWREEGQAVYDTNTRSFTLDILKLSYWMAASNIYDDTCLQSTLVDKDGNPLGGVQVRSLLLDEEDRGFSFTTNSDKDGNFAIVWKKLSRLKLQFSNPNGEQIEQAYIAGNGGVGILPPDYGLSTCLLLEPIVVDPSAIMACQGTKAAECDDKNECTMDGCLGDTCQYQYTAAGTSCGASKQCDGQGSCQENNCLTECCDDADCDDNNACTTNTCNSAGRCEYALGTVDGDGDGSPDICDPCPMDPKVARFNWARWTDSASMNAGGPRPNRIRGQVGNTDVSYNSNIAFEVIAGNQTFARNNFPTSFGAPFDSLSLHGVRNRIAGDNTVEFGRVVSDPLLVFASIGSPSIPVGIEFSHPIELVWPTAADPLYGALTQVDEAAGKLTGVEGYAIIKIPGQHSSVGFEYLVSESWTDFLFGFEAGNMEMCAQPCQTECCDDSDCNDQLGCTQDTCNMAGSCEHKPLCTQGEVVWNDLDQLRQDGTITFDAQTTSYAVPIPTPNPTNVVISRVSATPGNQNIAPYTTLPAAANNGSFNATRLNTPISWQGPFDYINVNPASNQLNNGTITFDFQKAATDNGPGWHYIFGITALGFSSQGVLSLTSNQDLQYLGALDVWTGGTDPKVSFDQSEARTITGPAGGPNTALEFFLLPQGASALTLTMDNVGISDSFGMWVGAVNLGEACSAQSATGMCVVDGLVCGDAIKASSEQCDDGNDQNGDGCSANCMIEANSTCTHIGTSFCERTCGAFGLSCCQGNSCDSPFQCNASSNTCGCSSGVDCNGACCQAGEYCRNNQCLDPNTQVCLDIFKPSNFNTPHNDGCQNNGTCLTTCNEILTADRTSASGVYWIRQGSSTFKVMCDMDVDAGGWTLVGFEPAGLPGPGNGSTRASGVMAKLSQEGGSADAIAANTSSGSPSSGYIGPRFDYMEDYREARFSWCTGAQEYRYQRFTTSADLFEDTVRNRPISSPNEAMIPLSNFATNDAVLSSQLTNTNDAAFCRAYAGALIPGDTSWAIKQKDEASSACGCNSGGWQGTGSYYGGKGDGGQTVCSSWGGGWAGTAGNGVQKGGVSSNTFYFWIR